MHEKIAVEKNHGGIPNDPLADSAVGTPSKLVLEKAKRRCFDPRLLDRIAAHLGIELAIRRLDDVFLRGIYRLAAFGRSLVGKGCIVPGRHITEVSGDIHGLVIADENDDLASGALCFALQPYEVQNDLERVRAEVDDVAGLNQGGVPAGPGAFSVNEFRVTSKVAPSREVAMQVANRNNAMHGGCGCR